ncbi:hypothetical protein [Ruegeria aquimaris]|uniref:Uncharacterized protein n=1 Tax=Ruegeria aquimaris TaxID=2984333 RepID=A0ABT3ANR9_9RHOB|nr:hypothetical protein [Ruegeria sp. XHP0148]MCV2890308.1 hypothetical protein [Ruegeria sp. XHP0148]
MISAYDLPYRALLSPPGQSERGLDFELKLLFDDVPSGDQVETAAALVMTFDALVASGGLGGRKISPANADIEYSEFVGIRGHEIHWKIGGMRLDDAAQIILAQSFMMLKGSSRLLEISLSPQGFSGKLIEPEKSSVRDDPYPGLHPSTEAVLVSDGDYSSDILVTAIFENQPRGESADEVLGRIGSWMVGAVSGFYPVAPVEPEFCSVRDPGEIRFYKNEIEIPLHRFLCHAGALNGLANAILATGNNAPQVRSIIVE